MMSMFRLFKKNNTNTDAKTYENFLNSIDNLSAARLRGIDLSFAVLKSRFKEKGFELTEIACLSSTVDIKRNQNGFYVDESRALFSDEEFNCYQYGVNFYQKYRDDFERIHNLLTEKELIMDGYYNIKNKRVDIDNLKEMSHKLGYGETRKNILYEEKPIHPSKEFNKLALLLEKAKNSADYDEQIHYILVNIRPYFKDNYKVEAKEIDDKYDLDFDDSFGVIVKNTDNGDIKIIYEVDGFDIRKDEYEQYLKKECPYLEIYFRIISKCIKSKFAKNNEKKRKKY